jgi:hypothetical protein
MCPTTGASLLQRGQLPQAFAAAAAACRVNLSALCIFVTIWHIIVYCPIAHMVSLLACQMHSR